MEIIPKHTTTRISEDDASPGKERHERMVGCGLERKVRKGRKGEAWKGMCGKEGKDEAWKGSVERKERMKHGKEGEERKERMLRKGRKVVDKTFMTTFNTTHSLLHYIFVHR